MILDLIDTGIRLTPNKAPSSIIIVTGAAGGLSDGLVQLVSVRDNIIVKPYEVKKDRLGPQVVHVNHVRLAPTDYETVSRWEYVASSFVWAPSEPVPDGLARTVYLILEREGDEWELAIRPQGSTDWICTTLPDYDPRVYPGSSNAWRYIIGEDAF